MTTTQWGYGKFHASATFTLIPLIAITLGKSKAAIYREAVIVEKSGVKLHETLVRLFLACVDNDEGVWCYDYDSQEYAHFFADIGLGPVTYAL